MFIFPYRAVWMSNAPYISVQSGTFHTYINMAGDIVHVSVMKWILNEILFRARVVTYHSEVLFPPKSVILQKLTVKDCFLSGENALHSHRGISRRSPSTGEPTIGQRPAGTRFRIAARRSSWRRTSCLLSPTFGPTTKPLRTRGKSRDIN